jgi:hypothetical protein
MRFSITAAFVGAAALMSSVSADFYNRLNVDDAAFLFVDHQTGLLNLVQDYNPDTYLNNVMGLAESAKYYKVSWWSCKHESILTITFNRCLLSLPLLVKMALTVSCSLSSRLCSPTLATLPDLVKSTLGIPKSSVL